VPKIANSKKKKKATYKFSKIKCLKNIDQKHKEKINVVNIIKTNEKPSTPNKNCKKNSSNKKPSEW